MEPAQPSVTGDKLRITLAVMAAALMSTIDISIINVALSDIRASFGTPIDQIGWVSTGYMMANVVIIPLTGWFQRRFGFRRYLSLSILLFTAASALCGLAWNLPSLVAFRILQGMGGGAIIPTAQAVLFARYPRQEHSMAGAIFGLGAITGPLLGPTIGGYLIDWSSWHWIFYVNVPVGLLAAGLAWTSIEEPAFRPDRRRIDLFGIATLAVGMASLQYVLEEGNREGWFESTTILVLAAVAAIALVTFLVHVLESDDPIVDVRVFADRSYAAGTGINFMVGLALFSGSYLFSLYCGTIMHYTALDIGLVFLAAGAVQIVLMPLVGRLGSRVDGRWFLAGGLPLLVYSLWVNGHLNASASYWDLVQPQMLRSVALAGVFVPLSVMTLSGVSDRQRGNATGLFNLTRELGGSIGTAWMGSSLDHHTRRAFAYLGEHVNSWNPITSEQVAQLQRALGVSGGTDALARAYAGLAQRLNTQALVQAFDAGFLEAAALCSLSVLLIALLRKPRPGAVVEGAH